MKNKLLACSALIAGLLLLLTVPLRAHHGTASYDDTKYIVLNGTLAAFEFVNPHVLIHIDVKDSTGNVQHWTVEMSPPSLAGHAGWSKDMMKPGDQISYEVHPARNGAFVGRGSNKITINGKTVGTGPQ
jgi:hypothetical protein